VTITGLLDRSPVHWWASGSLCSEQKVPPQ